MFEQQLNSLISSASAFPTGTTVYHKGTGQRGIVIGYSVYHDGSSRIMIDWIQGQEYDKVIDCVLSLNPLPDYTVSDGDEWKETV